MRQLKATVWAAILAVLICYVCALGSAQPMSPSSKPPQTEFSFPVQTGRPPVIVRVQISDAGTIGDTLLIHTGESTPFQTIPRCQLTPAAEFYQPDQYATLVKHADFNFDRFEDLELLQTDVPHLGKSIFCVYLWDEKSGRFRFEPQIPDPDPIPHPENKTITTHNEYMGGTHSDSVYVWRRTKVMEIASWGLANETGMPGTNPNCPWTTFCYKLINGKMQTVSMKATGCNGTDPVEVTCTPPTIPMPIPAQSPRK